MAQIGDGTGGVESARRLTEFGWHVLHGDIQLVADTISEKTLGLARAWCPSGTFALRGSSELLYVMLLVEGQASLMSAGRQQTLDSGQIVLLAGGSAVTVEAVGPLTQFLCYVRPAVLGSPFFRELVEKPLQAGVTGRQSFLATVNATLNDPQRGVKSPVVV